METILLIEDDQSMLRGLRDALESQGFRVASACTGPAGVELAGSCTPDLILLDVMLPLMNGFEVCKAIRLQDPDVPVLMLTARDEETEVVRGLKSGADGYMTKPFGIRELLARVEAMLRRKRKVHEVRFAFSGYLLDPATRRLMRGEEEIRLSPREFALLDYFVRHPGRALSREEILREVWGPESEASPRTIDRFVTVLRGKLEAPGEAGMIETLREFGYRFAAPMEKVE